MTDRFLDIRQKLLCIAENDPSIQAVILLGSSVRRFSKADQYSDLDVILVTTKPKDWLYGDLPARLGEVKLSFVEPTFGGGMERRLLYSGSLDVDLIVLTPEQLDTAFSQGAAAEVLCRGYAVMLDRMGIRETLADRVVGKLPKPQPTQEEYRNTVHDFWFHAVWSAKKILRGELWIVKMCIDAYMKRLLLKLMEWSEAGRKDVWHNGRFLEAWAGEETLTSLGGCFARYEREALFPALRNTAALFSRLAHTVAEQQGFAYPTEAEAYALELLEEYESCLK